LVGRIADRGPEYVSAREWMRICFELLELLKAHKKAIRRATVNTFGYIAKAIGETEIVMVIMYTIIFFFSTTNFRPTRCIGYTA
jgi:splicing factor 3B subunit 1